MNLSKATLRHLCHTCNSKNFLCAECIVRGEEEQEQKQNDRRRHPRHQQMRTLSSSLFDHRFQGDVQDRVVNIGSVQREEDCSFPDDLRKINDEGAPKQNKKLLDSMIVFGVNPTYSYTVIVLCILCYLFFVIPAFNNPKSYSPSCGSSTTSTTISFITSRFFPKIYTNNAGTSNSNSDLFLTPTILSEKSTVDFTSRQEEQQQRQDEEKELNFLTWVAFAYTAVLLMVAAEGIWDDHFRAAASYKKTPAVSIKIHHDTLFKVIGWAFAGGAIMFMAWGVGFVLLDEW